MEPQATPRSNGLLSIQRPLFRLRVQIFKTACKIRSSSSCGELTASQAFAANHLLLRFHTGLPALVMGESNHGKGRSGPLT